MVDDRQESLAVCRYGNFDGLYIFVLKISLDDSGLKMLVIEPKTDNEITTNRLADRYLSIKCQDVKCLAMILEDQQPEH